MRVLVSGAGSSVAYHLMPLLAAGDVFQHQGVDLVLCDTGDGEEEVMGVAMELRDCAFPALLGVSTTADFCGACKSADVILVLSDAGNHGNKKLDVCWSRLPNVDFPSLDGALHPGISRQDMRSLHARGPLSAARAIAECLRLVHMEAIQKEVHMTFDSREEAEFGCVPDPLVESVCSSQCENHLPAPFTTDYHQQGGALVMIATVRETRDGISEQKSRHIEVDMMSSLHARL